MSTNHYLPEPVAVVGFSGRFPGAKEVTHFWKNLLAAKESISPLTDDVLRDVGVNDSLLNDSKYVKRMAYLDDVAYFDADFFGYTDKEAELIDPQHRLFLEQAWQALEHAGINPDQNSRIGVFGSANLSAYLYNNWQAFQQLSQSTAELMSILHGNAPDHLCTRVAYKLNLTGPAMTIQTACSSSLVAVHVAMQSLLAYECDIALAGGVSLRLPQEEGYLYETNGVLSPDGYCRPFDAQANGTLFGSGVGIVVLKRLTQAIQDTDTIYAVIRSSAINNDGGNKMGYTAPSITGQARVIAEALAVAEIAPETIGYIEAHGTATALGDPIEIEALEQVFKQDLPARQFCAIGSLKANVGHLNAAAGVAGLIKTILMLKHQQIPATLHFSTPNTKIDFANSPFYVNQFTKPWTEAPDFPRRAGVSSFGVGGTNAHLVLEEYVQPDATAHSTQTYHLLPLSAKSELALRDLKHNMLTYLQNTIHPIAHIAHTLQVGRKHFSARTYCVCRNASEAIQWLSNPSLGNQVCASADHTSEHARLLELGQAWQQHKTVCFWELYPHDQRRKVPIPGHPLKPKAYWIVNPDRPIHHRETANDRQSTSVSHRYPRPSLPTPFVAAETLVEQKLAELWASTFKLELVGILDNFYALGGNSLLATQLFSKLERIYPIACPIELLEEKTTIQSLAQYIEAQLLVLIETLSEEDIEKMLQTEQMKG